MTIESATLVAQLRATETGSNDYGGPEFSPELSRVISLVNGTGAGQADILWADEITLTSGSSTDLDLAGSLSAAFGSTITMAELVALLIINLPRSGVANTTNLTVGGGSNPVTGFLGGTTPTVGPLRPGSFLFLGSSDAAGLGTVTAGTGDILRITNSAGGSNTFQIAILARSA